MKQTIMIEKIAIDTNILVYLRDTNKSEKFYQALEIMTLLPVVSAQVISEYLNVTKRLFKLTKQEIINICLNDLENCPIQAVKLSTLNLAKKLILRYDFQLFDSIVVAAALEAGCNILYSEDLQHELIVEKQLKIVNPFI